jgi:OOP family OmpA-OmpF porin
MKQLWTFAVLAIGSVLLLVSHSRAQNVCDFTERTPSSEELINCLKFDGPTPKAIGQKVVCAFSSEQPAGKGIGLVSDSLASTLPKPAAVPIKVHFAYDSAELLPDAKKTLDDLGQALSSDDLAACCFRIEGHTDSTGSHEYNDTLSVRRAQSVVRYLKERFNIDGERMLAKGYGKRDPMTSNDTEERRAKNRRVQIVNLGYGTPVQQ